MSDALKVLEYARGLCDVAGAVDNFLILGLESRTNLDFDTFVVEGNKFRFPGFMYFNPKIEAILKNIHEIGFEAKQVRGSEIKIKPLAVRAGIGNWGKNSLVINPNFGPWLRFVLIETNFDFTFLHPRPERSIFYSCRNCDKCVKACPVSALEPFRIPERQRCIAYLQLDRPTEGMARRCDVCQGACQPQRP